MSGAPTSQNPQLLRCLLRARDRMDVASHEHWPVRRLALVSGISEAYFARSFSQAIGVPPLRLLAQKAVQRGSGQARNRVKHQSPRGSIPI